MNSNLYNKHMGITELTTNDFNIQNNIITTTNTLFNNKQGFVIFYAPWCKYCRETVSLWSYIALSYSNIFVITAVNCDSSVNIDINNKLNIRRRFPTIKYVDKNNKLHNYKGNITKDELIYFICKHS
jgi:thiol-disulfide isomerase/thioredoxin